MTLLDLKSKLSNSKKQLAKVEQSYKGLRIEDSLLSNLRKQVGETEKLIREYGKGLLIKVRGECFISKQDTGNINPQLNDPNWFAGKITDVKVEFEICYIDVLNVEIPELLKIDVPTYIPQSLRIEQLPIRKVRVTPK